MTRYFERVATSSSDQCTPGLRTAMEGEIASPVESTRLVTARNRSRQLWGEGAPWIDTGGHDPGIGGDGPRTPLEVIRKFAMYFNILK
jgi:hypothetical protein